MQQKTISYKHSTINYRIFGSGSEVVFGFHGYGEHAGTFAVLEKFIAESHTIVAIDFPFHGNTIWNEDLLFTPFVLLEILQSINPFPEKKFSLMGYSMGGRIALKMLELYPSQIKKLVLLAPDGFHNNFWHWLSTQTFIGNKLFKICMHYPQPMFWLMEGAYKLSLFNKSVYNFVKSYLIEKESRLILYKRWTTLRKFYPDLKLIQKELTEQKIKMELVFGKYDKIILTKRGLTFQEPVKSFVIVTELEAGHQLLKEKYAQQIASFL